MRPGNHDLSVNKGGGEGVGFFVPSNFFFFGVRDRVWSIVLSEGRGEFFSETPLR